MDTVQKQIEVNLPVGAVYSQWSKFEEFPKFMEGVKEVRRLSPNRLYWRAEIFGKEKEWEAEVYEQIPEKRISWRSTAGAPNTGSVGFEELEGNRTQVSLAISLEPQSTLERIGDALGIVSSRIQGDLENFKKLAESRGTEVGAGREQFEHGHVKNY